MIDTYIWDPESSQLSPADSPVVTRPDPQRWAWLDLQGEDADTVLDLAGRFGLDPILAEESISVTDLSRIEELDDSVFVVLHGFVTGEGARLQTTEVDVFVSHSFLITVHRAGMPTFDALKTRIAETGGFAVPTPAALLAVIADLLAKRLVPLIDELENQVDGLEEEAIRGNPQTAVDAHALRRDVIHLRRAIGPQLGVYEEIAQSTHPVFDVEAKLVFARVARGHGRVLESVEASRALLGSVLETYRGAINEQTNEIMRVLTVFSAIMLPLALIAGIWGMNFTRIPGGQADWGFWALVGGMVIVAGGVWVYFSRRGFIGAPRLRDFPRAVGIGLATITVLPVKVVADGLRQLGRSDE